MGISFYSLNLDLTRWIALATGTFTNMAEQMPERSGCIRTCPLLYFWKPEISMRRAQLAFWRMRNNMKLRPPTFPLDIGVRPGASRPCWTRPEPKERINTCCIKPLGFGLVCHLAKANYFHFIHGKTESGEREVPQGTEAWGLLTIPPQSLQAGLDQMAPSLGEALLICMLFALLL